MTAEGCDGGAGEELHPNSDLLFALAWLECAAVKAAELIAQDQGISRVKQVTVPSRTLL